MSDASRVTRARVLESLGAVKKMRVEVPEFPLLNEELFAAALIEAMDELTAAHMLIEKLSGTCNSRCPVAKLIRRFEGAESLKEKE